MARKYSSRKARSVSSSFSYTTTGVSRKESRLNVLKETTAKSREQRFQRYLKRVPHLLAGNFLPGNKHEKKVVDAFWSAAIYSLFNSIHKAYLKKSKGQADELGETWPDLSPYTKAYKKSRRGKLTKKQQRHARSATPGLLTPTQYKEWKKNFFIQLSRLKRHHNDPGPGRMQDLKAAAAQYAWTVAKREGAETLLGVLGNQKYPIMVETGKLLRSLTPGKINTNKTYHPFNRWQVVKIKKGEAEIGTKIPYATVAEGRGHYYRPLWSGKIDIFLERAIEAGRDAIAIEIENTAKVI
jgi:hypothetical protein